MTARVDDERSRASSASTSVEQERSLLATRNQSRRGRVQDRHALSTSAISAGIPAWRAARAARASAARAEVVRSRRMAIPATTSS